MVLTGEGVLIKFDGYEDVAVTVPDSYFTEAGANHRLNGLCGNFDGNPNNDWTDFTGFLRTDVNLFAHVYQIDKGECKESLMLPSLFYNPDNNEDTAFNKAEAMCDVINMDAFKPCHATIFPDEYKLICMQDVISCNFNARSDCMCSSLSLYSRVCHKHGVKISWRKPDLCRKFILFFLESAIWKENILKNFTHHPTPINYTRK